MQSSGKARHRLSASPASTVPACSRPRRRACSLSYAPSTAEVSRSAAACCAAAAPASSGMRELRESRMPWAVRAMTCARAAGSCVWWTSQVRSDATAEAGRSPPPQADSGNSGTVKRGT
ncbi:hypothetical protein SHIRM173S_05859 [Streptomyces hirsutus]